MFCYCFFVLIYFSFTIHIQLFSRLATSVSSKFSVLSLCVYTPQSRPKPVALRAAIFIFSYSVCFERRWRRCSAAGVNWVGRLTNTQSADVNW